MHCLLISRSSLYLFMLQRPWRTHQMDAWPRPARAVHRTGGQVVPHRELHRHREGVVPEPQHQLVAAAAICGACGGGPEVFFSDPKEGGGQDHSPAPRLGGDSPHPSPLWGNQTEKILRGSLTRVHFASKKKLIFQKISRESEDYLRRCWPTSLAQLLPHAHLSRVAVALWTPMWATVPGGQHMGSFTGQDVCGKAPTGRPP